MKPLATACLLGAFSFSPLAAQTIDQALAEAAQQGVRAGKAAADSTTPPSSPAAPAPGAETPADSSQSYEALIDQITALLTPAKGRLPDAAKAWELLPQASEHPLDARLCDALAAAVYNAWSAQRQDEKLATANRALERARENTSWNAQQSVQNSGLGVNPPKDDKAIAEWTTEQQMRRQIRMQPYLTRLAELEAMIKANQVKREVTELQSKIEFQSLILQMFLQRRFRHVLLACAFYRGIFNDGDGKLRVGTEAEEMIQKYSGVPPHPLRPRIPRPRSDPGRPAGRRGLPLSAQKQRTRLRLRPPGRSLRRGRKPPGDPRPPARGQTPLPRIHPEGQPAHLRHRGQGLRPRRGTRRPAPENRQGLRSLQAARRHPDGQDP